MIDDNTVYLTLGIEAPEILSEGDFDFATALDAAAADANAKVPPKAEPSSARTEQKDS